jgi:hypothetical protein
METFYIKVQIVRLHRNGRLLRKSSWTSFNDQVIILNQMPADLAKEFEEEHVEPDYIKKTQYKEPNPKCVLKQTSSIKHKDNDFAKATLITKWKNLKNRYR